MEVQLTPEQKAFIRQAIESGRLQREEDAVQEALSLWEERERRRLEILAAVDKAEASLARGERGELGTHSAGIFWPTPAKYCAPRPVDSASNLGPARRPCHFTPLPSVICKRSRTGATAALIS